MAFSARMAGVTGFATGMIAGALWLVFLIGLALSARNSPGHPFKSINRFRSSTRSLDVDVPSALKPPSSGGSEVRIMHHGVTPVRDTGRWDEPRSQDPTLWDEPRSKPSRQMQRPALKPVPDLPEPTLQVDSASFFEPEHPRTRNRPARSTFEQPVYQPTLTEAKQPELMRAAATSGPGGFGGDNGPRTIPPSNMSGSGLPPQGPPEPPRAPEPSYPTAPGFAPESFPTEHAETPPSQSSASGPSGSAFPPPEPFKEPKQGRFGKRARKEEKAPKQAPAPVAATPPVVQPPASVQAKPKKEKKGLFNKSGKAPEAPAAAVPPPSVPAAPAIPPKPRFSAPFNYTPPGSTPAPTQPRYPTVSSTSPPNRTWGPPASFTPPASPSFGNWGAKQDDAAPAPAQQNDAPGPGAGEPIVPPASPFFANGNGNGHGGLEEPAIGSGQWPFGFTATNGNFAEETGPQRDPELPAYIELSMFQDPTSADDIAAEQDNEQDPEAEQGAETSNAQEAWLADDAWPAPKESRRRRKDPRPQQEQPAEETQLLEQHWPQDPPEPEVSAPDWTSADTPWPGETRRPAETTWANDPPAAHSEQPAQWGDEPWQQEARAPHPAEGSWTHREPPAGPVTDPWGRVQRGQSDPDSPVADPWGSRRAADDVPSEDPWVQARARQAEEESRQAEQARRQAEHDRQVEEARIADQARSEEAAAPPPVDRAPVEPEIPARQPSNGRQVFVDDEDWKPVSIDLNLEKDKPRRDPVAQAAARLKAAETAIKVDNGLAYVLVDDEGRPVLR